MICGCGKAALLISVRVTRQRNFRQHVRFANQRHKEAHFSFVAQTNQKCAAWTSQPNLVRLSSTESGAELSQLTPMHAQLLASNSLCSSSCTKSRPCQGKHRTISPRAAKVRQLVGSWEGRRKRTVIQIGVGFFFVLFFGDGVGGERTTARVSQLLVSVIWSSCVHNTAYTENGVSAAFLEPNVQLADPEHPNLFHFLISQVNPYLGSETWDCIFLLSVSGFPHIICPYCLGSLLPALPAPPTAPPPPLPHAFSIPVCRRSSGGATRAQKKMPISKMPHLPKMAKHS